MRDGTTRSVARRAAAILAAASLVLTAFMLSPAGAHFRPRIGHIVKHVKKKLTPGFDTRYIEEGELIRFGPVKAQTGTSNVPLASLGPLSLTGTCDLSGGFVRATIYVSTSEVNSTFFSNYWGSEDDFDPADPDGPVYWLQSTGDVPGGAQEITTGGNQAHFASPSGRVIEGITGMATNFASSHCTFWGYLLEVAPK